MLRICKTCEIRGIKHEMTREMRKKVEKKFLQLSSQGLKVNGEVQFTLR